MLMKSETNSGRKGRLRAGILGCQPDDQEQISLLLELLGWHVDRKSVDAGVAASACDVLFVGAAALGNAAAVPTIKNTYASEMVVVFRGAQPQLDIKDFPFKRISYIDSPLKIVELERLIEILS
jgi:hypothetical protein